MPSLFNRKPMDSYQELLKLTNTGAGLDTTLRTVEDGVGAISPLSLSTTQIALNGLIWPTTTPGSGQVLSVGAGDQLVWANVASGAQETPVQTYQGSLGISNSTLATVVQNTMIQEISLCNTSTTDIGFYLFLVPNGDTAGSSNAIFYGAQIQGGQTVVVSTEMLMLSGGTIQGYATSSGVNIKISGNTSTNLTAWFQGNMPTIPTAVYTVPNNKTNTVNSIIVCNTSNSPQAFSLYFGSSTVSNAYFNGLTVPVGTTVLADLATVLPAGATITTVSTSSALTLTITGF